MQNSINQLELIQPDDWHLHLRDGPAMEAVLADTARRFGRAIVMPNLKPPVTTVAQAEAYRHRILAALPAGSDFNPLMTLYLTEATSPDEIEAAAASDFVHGLKLYPAGATTNSAAGVTTLSRCTEVLARMEKLGLPLLVHGEVTDHSVDIFDREAVFIDTVLVPLRHDFPGLKLVLEHITTKQGIDFVVAQDSMVAGTLTAHHLLLNRNALFTGGIRPHNYCLPVLKRESHRQALLAAATAGSPKFFLGTDSAPHAKSTKEAACGCAGCYTANAGIELYAEAFDSVAALDKLEAFASFHGADFYGLPRNIRRITLVRADNSIPARVPFLPGDDLIPFMAGETIAWQMQDDA
jgi:dihydroorotase